MKSTTEDGDPATEPEPDNVIAGEYRQAARDFAAAHKFAGMDAEPNEPPLANTTPGPRRYRGLCICGHKEQWTTNKDWAWEEIASHFQPAIEALWMADALEAARVSDA